MPGSKFAVQVWRCFQNLTGQAGRGPNEVERNLIYGWERDTGGDPEPVEAGIEKAAAWRGKRGYKFRDLEQGKNSVDFEIESWHKAAPVHAVAGQVAKKLGGMTRAPDTVPVERVPPAVVEALRAHREKMREEMYGEEGE